MPKSKNRKGHQEKLNAYKANKKKEQELFKKKMLDSYIKMQQEALAEQESHTSTEEVVGPDINIDDLNIMDDQYVDQPFIDVEPIEIEPIDVVEPIEVEPIEVEPIEVELIDVEPIEGGYVKELDSNDNLSEPLIKEEK